MANELKVDYPSGYTLTAHVRNAAGQVAYLVGEVFEAWGTGGRTASDYATAMTDKSGGTYRGDFPSWITVGSYHVLYWDSAITEEPIHKYDIMWDGSAETTLADLIGEVDLGTGDYEVTLTIRTTAGTAVSGVRVWLSTDGDRENMATGALNTDDAGQIAVYCDYGIKYYLHCRLAGYSFASASFTPAAGSVTFTKDIATALSVAGLSSDYADSFLVRAIELVRKWCNEPRVNAKYSDSYIIDRLGVAFGLALGEKQAQEEDPLVMTLTVTMVDGRNSYALPATMANVLAVYHAGDYGTRIFYAKHSRYNMHGRGVWIQGNTLMMQDDIVALGAAVTIEAEPSGLARLHCGTCTLNSDGDEATLDATPYLGTLDRQVNAFAGSLLRIFNVTGTVVTGNCIAERLITEYDVPTRVAALDPSFDPIPVTDDGSIFYEIAPQIPIGLDTLLALYVAWEILSAEGLPKKAKGCLDCYKTNLRRLQLTASTSNLQSGGVVQADTVFNGRQGGGY